MGTSPAPCGPGRQGPPLTGRRKDGGSPCTNRGLGFPTPSSDARMRSPGAGTGVRQVLRCPQSSQKPPALGRTGAGPGRHTAWKASPQSLGPQLGRSPHGMQGGGAGDPLSAGRAPPPPQRTHRARTHPAALVELAHAGKPRSGAEPGGHDHSWAVGGENLEAVNAGSGQNRWAHALQGAYHSVVPEVTGPFAYPFSVGAAPRPRPCSGSGLCVRSPPPSCWWAAECPSGDMRLFVVGRRDLSDTNVYRSPRGGLDEMGKFLGRHKTNCGTDSGRIRLNRSIARTRREEE